MATFTLGDSEVSVMSDLVEVGRCPEEGTPIIGEVFYTIITMGDGSRLRHERNFYSHSFVLDNDSEFGGYFRIDVEGAEKKAKNLAYKVEVAGEFDFDRWESMRPCYGSEAYCEGGWSERDAQEERRRDMEGF